jgi:negative regulator of flagellin synthesis FlgM
MSFGIEGLPCRSPIDLTDPTTNKVNQTLKTPARLERTATRLDLHDRVSLTDQAAQLHALETQINEQPLVDLQRVTEVQRAMAMGNYHIDPNEVGNKLLQFERGLAGDQ